jgi:SET domain-containing protein
MINFPIEVKASRIDGKGAYALKAIPARRKLGNMGGEIISVREARKRVKELKRVSMVEFGDGRALDASVHPNDLRYINHSCDPNTYLRVCYSKVEFWSLRKIKKGEELTCDYGETHHDGKLPCRCGAKNCRGFI